MNHLTAFSGTFVYITHIIVPCIRYEKKSSQPLTKKVWDIGVKLLCRQDSTLFKLCGQISAQLELCIRAV